MEKDYSVNEDINQSIESRREDAFYSFDTSGTDERPSLKPIEERDFVQALPDNPISTEVGVQGFKPQRFVVIINGIANYKDFLVRDVELP